MTLNARDRITGEQASELVEAALVLSVLLTLLVGVIWLGRAYNIYQTITNAARQGARFAVAPSCATCGNTFPSDAEVRALVNAALSASALDPTKVSPAITIQRNVNLDTGQDPLNFQVAGVIISFGYIRGRW